MFLPAVLYSCLRWNEMFPHRYELHQLNYIVYYPIIKGGKCVDHECIGISSESKKRGKYEVNCNKNKIF